MFAESLSIQDRSRLPASDETKMSKLLAVALTYRIIIHFQLKMGKMGHFSAENGENGNFQLEIEKTGEFWSAFRQFFGAFFPKRCYIGGYIGGYIVSIPT